MDNLLYTPDADFSCFADLALTSPEDYYREGEGSLLQYEKFIVFLFDVVNIVMLIVVVVVDRVSVEIVSAVSSFSSENNF